MAATDERVATLEEYKRASEKRLDSIDAHLLALRRDMWIGFGTLATIMVGGLIAILTRLG